MSLLEHSAFTRSRRRTLFVLCIVLFFAGGYFLLSCYVSLRWHNVSKCALILRNGGEVSFYLLEGDALCSFIDLIRQETEGHLLEDAVQNTNGITIYAYDSDYLPQYDLTLKHQGGPGLEDGGKP